MQLQGCGKDPAAACNDVNARNFCDRWYREFPDWCPGHDRNYLVPDYLKAKEGLNAQKSELEKAKEDGAEGGVLHFMEKAAETTKQATEGLVGGKTADELKPRRPGDVGPTPDPWQRLIDHCKAVAKATDDKCRELDDMCVAYHIDRPNPDSLAQLSYARRVEPGVHEQRLSKRPQVDAQ